MAPDTNEPPEPTAPLSVTVPWPLLDDLDQAAEALGTTRDAALEAALRTWLRSPDVREAVLVMRLRERVAEATAGRDGGDGGSVR